MLVHSREELQHPKKRIQKLTTGRVGGGERNARSTYGPSAKILQATNHLIQQKTNALVFILRRRSSAHPTTLSQKYNSPGRSAGKKKTRSMIAPRRRRATTAGVFVANNLASCLSSLDAAHRASLLSYPFACPYPNLISRYAVSCAVPSSGLIVQHTQPFCTLLHT